MRRWQILAASIMTDETVTIDNLPDVRDINVLIGAMEDIGAIVERVDRHTVKINGSRIQRLSVDYEYIKKIRASYYLLGALLGKYKKAEVALPGGCEIGSRPIDLHIKGFKALGRCGHQLRPDFRKAQRLVGSHIYMDKVSVGATINVMMAAALAEGKTVIENAAKEPHVVDVANFLNSMGANIRGAGTDVIRIVGVEKLHRTEYSVIPDQIEAGTFMCAAAVTGGDVLIKNVIPKHLEATTAKLLDAGCQVEEYDDAVRVFGDGALRSTQVTTLPYPGFPTDMQPQMTVVLGIAQGTSTVTESIFENRFKYVDELRPYGSQHSGGGQCGHHPRSGTLHGRRGSARRICGRELLWLVAGLAADGVTVVDDIYYIQRGYENLEGKLRQLGAQIEKVSSEKEIQKFVLKVS